MKCVSVFFRVFRVFRGDFLMNLTVRLFARARELAGTDQLKVEVSAGATVADLRNAIIVQIPALGPLLAVSAMAVNHDFATESQALIETDEVAIIPPVSGG